MLGKAQRSSHIKLSKEIMQGRRDQEREKNTEIMINNPLHSTTVDFSKCMFLIHKIFTISESTV